MKCAEGIFRESIHNNLSDKRNMDNPKRQDYFIDWKLTRPPREREERGRERASEREIDGKAGQIIFIRLHIILYQCLLAYQRRQSAQLKTYYSIYLQATVK